MTKLFEATDYVEMPLQDIITLLQDAGPGDVADLDYIDVHTGEIVWEKGDKASSSYYHFDAPAKVQKWIEDDYDDDVKYEDDGSQEEFDNAVEQFVASIDTESYVDEQGELTRSEAQEIASSFFSEYADELKRWMAQLDMSRRQVQSFVIDSLYKQAY